MSNPQASILAPRQSSVREPEPTPQVSRPKGILALAKKLSLRAEEAVQRPASKLRESRSGAVRAETRVEPVTPELRRNDSDADQRESSSRPLERAKLQLHSQLSTSDSQLKTPGLVRPAVTVQKIRAVQAVVPAIRTVPQFPPTPARACPDDQRDDRSRRNSRHVTGAGATARTQPKSANVLSLEDYLRQRAKGGGR